MNDLLYPLDKMLFPELQEGMWYLITTGIHKGEAGKLTQFRVPPTSPFCLFMLRFINGKELLYSHIDVKPYY